jgi:hypothetical protein
MTNEMQVSPKRSQPLYCVHMFLDHKKWRAIQALAKRRDVTASELVRRLIADELQRYGRRTK